MPSNMLRNIPSVHELLESQPLKRLTDTVSRNVVVSGIRTFLDNMRTEAKNAAAEMNLPTPPDLAERIAQWILTEEQPPLRPVINATGILLHTGLGRAPLAAEAVAEIETLVQGYCSLEVDLDTGERSHRVHAVTKLLKELTGAEAAAVVNNNAGATLLTLAALAAGGEAIVSRGELIEIGGSFRLPDVMAASGATLREVGTTNKTRIRDYINAIGDETAALMKVHTSNYLVVGFTEDVSIAELAATGKVRQRPVIHDIGSGALMDMEVFGLSHEPLVRASIKAGADVVLFSGDKLLGGPQCGIIVGRRALVDKIARHPLMRALRVGKLTLAALWATLRLYRDSQIALQSVPLLTLLNTSTENLKNRAERLAPQLAATSAICSASAIENECFLGGGSMPSQRIPTWCVALAPAQGGVDLLAKQLRTGIPSVFGRVHQDRLLLDLRSVMPGQDMQIVEAIAALAGPSENPGPAAESSG